MDSKYKNKSLSDTFRNIYLTKEWGDPKELGINKDEKQFFSGTGSYSKASLDYVNFIVAYVRSNNIKSIVDIGCGDFNIGKQIMTDLPDILYTGIDIFQEIIDYNNKMFSSKKIQFKMIDTTIDTVPSADLLLVREVFQHLSNASISKIIDLQFNLFKSVLVTECLPPKEYLFSYNLDKPDGPGYRGDHGSGIFLDKPPFNLKTTQVLSTPHAYFGNINTFKITK